MADEKKPTILLDMDGVCVQFMYPALRAQGMDHAGAMKFLHEWPKGKFTI